MERTNKILGSLDKCAKNKDKARVTASTSPVAQDLNKNMKKLKDSFKNNETMSDSGSVSGTDKGTDRELTTEQSNDNKVNYNYNDDNDNSFRTPMSFKNKIVLEFEDDKEEAISQTPTQIPLKTKKSPRKTENTIRIEKTLSKISEKILKFEDNKDAQIKLDKLEKLEKDEKDEILLKNHITLNVNAINQRLLEKIKTIKHLEKELKDKTQNNDNYKVKVERQQHEIQRLNILVDEDLKNKLSKENYKLKRQLIERDAVINEKNIIIADKEKMIKDKNDRLEERVKMYESMIEKYTSQVENLIQVNDESMKQIYDLEMKIEDKNKYLDLNMNLEMQIKNLKENFDLEIKEKKKNKLLINKFKHLLGILHAIDRDKKLLMSQNQGFIDKVVYFFEPEREDDPNEKSVNESDNNLTDKDISSDILPTINDK